jgi:hypothetical protein
MNDQSECDGRQPKRLEDAEGEQGLHPNERELVKIKQIVGSLNDDHWEQELQPRVLVNQYLS